MGISLTHGFILLSIPLAVWVALVQRTVSEPYLVGPPKSMQEVGHAFLIHNSQDEYFHVPQAQQYCTGDFKTWDPKITTPPGLYILTYLLQPLFSCSVNGCREASMISMIAFAWMVQKIFSRRIARPEDESKGSWMAQHNALNIALFPPLFFFSALYYTDVASTLSVMLAHYPLIASDKAQATQWWWSLQLIILGLLSLFFRQTNIFWVAVFPAGVVLAREMDRGHEAIKDSMYRRVEGFGDSFQSVAKTTWKMEVLYDPPVRDASVEDYIKCLISFATCTVKVLTQPHRLRSLCVTLLPYILMVVSFAGFVVWNGSVVLGDKEHHVATVHTPQLLYLWPYLVFFSWPFAFQHLVRIPLTLFAIVPAVATLEQFFVFKRRAMLPRSAAILLFAALALSSIFFNTIVHKFTLADNRHYVFYVFKRLMNPWYIRYLAIPAYLLSAWITVQALGSAPQSRTRPAGPSDPAPSHEREATTASAGSPRRALPLPDTRSSANTSFLIIWLATTALNLITAPLVEPRYFILPWIFFRLHLPMSHPPEAQSVSYSGIPEPDRKATSWETFRKTFWDEHDKRLWLETVWFLVVNAGTGYMFLYKGFEWESEPGKVQRFMW